MTKNVGRTDAIIRFTLSFIFIVTGIILFNTLQSVSIALFVFSAMLILTSLVGRCGLYKVFGINTCPIDKR